MAETPAERLARIQAAMHTYEPFMGMPLHNCRPPMDVTAADVEWLLTQIPAGREYRVEGWCQIDDAGPWVWSPWDGPYETAESAWRQAGGRNRDGSGRKFRVTSRPAPVEGWTVEEEPRG